jgi:hypothetical protein
MKRSLILALSLAFLIPAPAFAHEPVTLLNTDTTAANGPLLVDGTTSYAVKAAFTKAGQTKAFRVGFKAGDELSVQYLIVDKKPDNTVKNSAMPTVVITSPTGKKTTMRLNERGKFYEPRGLTNYLYLSRYNAAAEAGIYNFVVTARGNSVITVAVGENYRGSAEIIRGDVASPTPTS